MVNRKAVWIALLSITSIGGAAMPMEQFGYAPTCRHGQAPTEEDRARRAQAVTLAKAINTAQASLVQRTQQYHPVESLGNLPAVPAGFELNLFADHSGYMFAIKDTQDPCWFAVFSDNRGLVYEKSALDAPAVAQ